MFLLLGLLLALFVLIVRDFLLKCFYTIEAIRYNHQGYDKEEYDEIYKNLKSFEKGQNQDIIIEEPEYDSDDEYDHINKSY